MRANIFNIQRFSLDDGPGIRTVVYTKGCNLHCEWCHNPESISFKPQIMRIDSKCQRCGKCAAVCPERAITKNNDMYITDYNTCTNCNMCINECLYDALIISGKEMSVEEVFDEIIKDRDYYDESGGGVTFSGGEPTCHSDFLSEILRMCNENNISTAIETNGQTDLGIVKKLSPLLDYVIVDFKHYDETKLKRFTGADPETIMKSIKYYIDHNKTEVRIPIIPDFNDSPTELNTMLEILENMSAKHITTIPYHTYGISKYTNLGMEYKYGRYDEMDKDEYQNLVYNLQRKHHNLI